MEKSDIRNFPSPKPLNKGFTQYWDLFLQDIQERENLKKSHLMQLRVLCDQCVEYDELQEVILLEGRTYISEGRNGNQVKLRPEVAQLSKCIVEIRNYSKMLGLVLVKDNAMTNTKEDENPFN